MGRKDGYSYLKGFGPIGYMNEVLKNLRINRLDDKLSISDRRVALEVKDSVNVGSKEYNFSLADFIPSEM